jgi:tRNA(Ile)-lysidine synthase
MARSRPPSLVTLVRGALFGECDVSAGDSILVAVSGGTDSTALLHALWLVAKRSKLEVTACGIDHGLRAEAGNELAAVARLCQSLGLEFERVELHVARGSNLQARAREARYEALRTVQRQRGVRWLATAHHADDRAETVLMRLLRGAPPQGLAVLPARSRDLIRPMIRARHTDVVAHLARHRLAFSNDPSNEDVRFLRVRVRREVLPLLLELSPGIVSHLCALADEVSAPALPKVLDDQGLELRLGRGQRREIQKALRDRSTYSRVLIDGARAIRVSPNTGRLEIVEENAKKGLVAGSKPPHIG